MQGKLGVACFAALLAGAGCGSSGGTTGTLTFTTKTTTTLASPTTGELVRCHTLHAKIPPQGASLALSGTGASASARLALTRTSDGSLIISCKP
jgi:hypothetical protein